MPTWTPRTSPTTSWGARPKSGESVAYDSSLDYDSDATYSGSYLSDPSWSTRSSPSTTWTARITPA